jgi:hypothetical protein
VQLEILDLLVILDQPDQ